MANRYQRGGVRLRGSVWYGFYRVDLPDGSRKAREVRLGTQKELPNKTEARKKLTELMDHREGPQDDPPATGNQPTDEPLTFAAVATMWRNSEGPGMGESSLKHYTNALRAYVLPILGDRALDSIHREDVTGLLNAQAPKYSRSALKSMRLVAQMVLSWAERNGKILRPNGWLDGIKLPRKCGGRKVVRVEIEPQHVLAIIRELAEPYATLVLFLAMCGRRIEEAIGIQPYDLDERNILHIRRIIYDGRDEELEQEQVLPLDAPEHAELVQRMRALGEGHTWVFHCRNGNPVNPGNARRRYLKPTAKAVGIEIAGWHDFRHSLQRGMRRGEVDPVVRAAVMGHKKVDLGPEVYDMATLDDKRLALVSVARQLQASVQAKGPIQ